MKARAPGERILEAATHLFCRDGFRATGINTILDQADAAKMTLYSCFGSKEGLITAVLEREGESWRAWFFDVLDRAGPDPRTRLLAAFDALGEWFARADFHGCAFINAAVETRDANSVREFVLDHKRKVLERIEALATEAGCAEPAELAHELGLLMDGAIVAALVTGNSKVAVTARRAAEGLIDLARQAGRKRRRAAAS
jgi:AcrR family transcriptional regulator